MRPLTSYVAFPTRADPPLTLAGKLSIPRSGAASPRPAVLLCHGSDGVDGRGEYHAVALLEAGLATLEVDMWAARGTGRGAAARPGSPLETLADAFGALAFLRTQPEIDPGRVGVMGFSWGGVVSLLSSARKAVDRYDPEGGGFSAHVAFYPVCWAFMPGGPMGFSPSTGAPKLIVTGEADAYDRPGAGARLLESLEPAERACVEHLALPGAGHGFDRDLPEQTIVDPFAHEGRGGPVLMRFDRAGAEAARRRATGFLAARLSLPAASRA